MSASKPRRGSRPGAQNSTAAEKAHDAVELSEGVVAAAATAPEADRQAEGAALADGQGDTPPTGGQDEAADEDRARVAEAVTPPGGSADEIAAAQVVATLEEADYTVTHLHVRALRDGFRRCGRAWPAAGVEVPAGGFSDEEITRLLNEPQLAVMPVFRPLPELE